MYWITQILDIEVWCLTNSNQGNIGFETFVRKIQPPCVHGSEFEGGTVHRRKSNLGSENAVFSELNSFKVKCLITLYGKFLKIPIFRKSLSIPQIFFWPLGGGLKPPNPTPCMHPTHIMHRPINCYFGMTESWKIKSQLSMLCKMHVEFNLLFPAQSTWRITILCGSKNWSDPLYRKGTHQSFWN